MIRSIRYRHVARIVQRASWAVTTEEWRGHYIDCRDYFATCWRHYRQHDPIRPEQAPPRFWRCVWYTGACGCYSCR